MWMNLYRLKGNHAGSSHICKTRTASFYRGLHRFSFRPSRWAWRGTSRVTVRWQSRNAQRYLREKAPPTLRRQSSPNDYALGENKRGTKTLSTPLASRECVEDWDESPRQTGARLSLLDAFFCQARSVWRERDKCLTPWKLKIDLVVLFSNHNVQSYSYFHFISKCDWELWSGGSPLGHVFLDVPLWRV